jgi:ataxin-3
MELQAALQASLSNTNSFDYSGFSQATAMHPASSFSPPPSALSRVQVPDDAMSDPIAASMARNLAKNKAMMQRMQREQEMALREGYQEEIGRHFGGESSRNIPRTNVAGEEDEEEAIQKAIEGTQPEEASNSLGLDVLDDDEMGRQTVPARGFGDRVYDDEDSELQAALKASLEMLPDDFIIPVTPPRPSIPLAASYSNERPESNVSTTIETPVKPEIRETHRAEPDAEEMRRRRLARFGGGQ